MQSPQHTIAVVAKCPIPGKSKTRLIPLLGEEGSVQLAKAMLSDVLTTISNCERLGGVRKILFYAPTEGLGIMRGILKELGLSEVESPSSTDGWMLLPMTTADLTANDLGDILTDILKRTRQLGVQGKVIFLGMDSPELPLEELVGCLASEEALLCPANDGGYGMLAVPPQAPTDKAFQGIRWSHSLTALAQLKALTDNNIPVKLGRMMNDIDEPHDVQALCQRLTAVDVPSSKDDVLLKSSLKDGRVQTGPASCTRRVLQELKLIPS